VLAHHDDGRRVGGLEGEREVQKNEWIGVPLLDPGRHVEEHPDHQHHALDDDEAPGSDHARHRVGDAGAKRDLVPALALPMPPAMPAQLDETCELVGLGWMCGMCLHRWLLEWMAVVRVASSDTRLPPARHLSSAAAPVSCTRCCGGDRD